MKLYYSSGACSLAPHIVLLETGHAFELEKVDIPNKKTASGADFWPINPKGYVPALQLDDGTVLTEVGVIRQYLADQKPAAGLAPAAGTMARYRLMEWLNFVATEVHKSIGALFNPMMTPEMKQVQKGLHRASPERAGENDRRQAVSDGRCLQRGRCLSVQRAALDRIPQNRPCALAQYPGVFQPCSGAAAGAGGDAG